MCNYFPKEILTIYSCSFNYRSEQLKQFLDALIISRILPLIKYQLSVIEKSVVNKNVQSNKNKTANYFHNRTFSFKKPFHLLFRE